MLAEVVGLALRCSLACPVEVNLMPPELVKQKTLKRRLPFLGLAAVGILLSLGIWTLHQRNMTELYASQRVNVEESLANLKTKQNNLNGALKKKEKVKTRTDALKSLLLSRSDWQRRLEAVRKSMMDGLWITEFKPIKNSAGLVEGVRLQGRGWVDKMRVIEESAKARGLKVSAVEELRDRLKDNAIFGENTEVKIIGSKEIEGYLAEFTIEVRQGAAPAVKDVAK
jgi:Tfp pilus assembly protein PilN